MKLPFLGALKDKILYVVLGKLARDIAEGKKGPKLQAYYLWSRGKKTTTGFIASVIFGAITTFAPPFARTFFAAWTVASGCLMALGLLDAQWNNKPAFPVWFLEALQRVTGLLAKLHVAMIPLTEIIHMAWPPSADYLPQAILVEAALSTACAYVNRLAAAALAPPPQMIPRTAITGEFSLAEVVEAVKHAPLIREQRLAGLKPGVEADAVGRKGGLRG